MKISMTVVMIFTTLFCLLPYIWFIVQGHTNTQKKAKQFADVINTLHLSLTIMEQWNNKFIGYDKSQNTLVFLKLNNQEFNIYTVELKQLKSCYINVNTQTVVKDNKRVSKLQVLDLELTMHTAKAPIILNFYDCHEEFTEDLELSRAQKWESLIKQHQLKTIEPPKAA
jgi:hypothetical protein